MPDRVEEYKGEIRGVVDKLLHFYLMRRKRPLFVILNCTIFFHPDNLVLTDVEDLDSVIVLRTRAGKGWSWVCNNHLWADVEVERGQIIIDPGGGARTVPHE